jgi:hypothetical protein
MSWPIREPKPLENFFRTILKDEKLKVVKE